MKTKKQSKKSTKGKTNPLRTQALATTAKASVIAAGVASYAKHHGLTASEATAKLMTIAVGRVAALAKYNKKPAKKTAAKKPAKRKAAAKTKPAGKARSAKPKVIAKAKPKGAPKSARQVKPAAATTAPSMAAGMS